MSFRLKTILGVALIEAVLLLVLIIMGMRFFGTTLNSEIGQHVRTSSNIFAATVQDAVINSDLAALESAIRNIMGNPDIVYVRVLGEGGEVLAYKDRRKGVVPAFREDTSLDQAKNDGVMDVSAVIRDEDLVHGRVELGFSVNHLYGLMSNIRQYAGGIAIVEMLLVALFSFMLGTYLTRQLVQLKKAAEQIKSGDFGYTVEVRNNDELGMLAKSFNAMSLRVRDLYNKVHREARQSREIVDSLGDGIVTFRADGIIQDVNQVVGRMFGYEDKDLVGRNVALLTPSSQYDAINMSGQSPDAGFYMADRKREMLALHKDGSLFPVDVSVTEVSGERGNGYFIAIIHDLTGQKTVEEIRSVNRVA